MSPAYAYTILKIMNPVKNEDYVARPSSHKLVEWYRDCPARMGRAPPAGNDGDDEAVEEGVGEGSADDAGGFTVQNMN